MIGIIFVVFLARHIGNMAEDKGKVKWHFWAATVAVWYGGQILFGLLLGVILAIAMGPDVLDEFDNPLVNIVISLIGGGAGYFILSSIIKRMPDQEDPSELIDRIGIDVEEDGSIL